jgi:hypothetical protein
MTTSEQKVQGVSISDSGKDQPKRRYHAPVLRLVGDVKHLTAGNQGTVIDVATFRMKL